MGKTINALLTCGAPPIQRGLQCRLTKYTLKRAQQLQSKAAALSQGEVPLGGWAEAALASWEPRLQGQQRGKTTKLSLAMLDPFLYPFLHSHQAHMFRGLGVDFPVTALTPKFLKTLECHCFCMFSLCKPSHSPYAWLVSVHLLLLSLINPRVSYNSLNTSFCKADLHPSYNLRRTHNFLTVPLTSCRHNKEHFMFPTRM